DRRRLTRVRPIRWGRIDPPVIGFSHGPVDVRGVVDQPEHTEGAIAYIADLELAEPAREPGPDGPIAVGVAWLRTGLAPRVLECPREGRLPVAERTLDGPCMRARGQRGDQDHQHQGDKLQSTRADHRVCAI